MRCPLCEGPTPQEQVQVCAEHGAMLDELAADIVTNRIRTTTLAELDARAESHGWWTDDDHMLALEGLA